jgi:hypothetical protein
MFLLTFLQMKNHFENYIILGPKRALDSEYFRENWDSVYGAVDDEVRTNPQFNQRRGNLLVQLNKSYVTFSSRSTLLLPLTGF